MNSACSCSNTSNMFQDAAEKTEKHPCYSADAHHTYARMHLPVAPVCNIQCNYCSRKYDCVHESRPGVTSEVLSPAEAAVKFGKVKEKIDNLSVVGIAGPGDALANWAETKAAIQSIQAIQPDIVVCLSTNGLMLPEYAQEIVELTIHHVTVTVNAVDPEIGAELYRFVNYKGQTLTGVEAAQVLLANQLAGIRFLARHGVLVKVNIVMVKDINDRHIPAVVKKVKELGAFITNIMPLIPAPGSHFEHLPQTSMKDVNAMRDICQIDIKQMRHCRQCRADAIGLLADDRSQEFRMCNASQEPAKFGQSPDKPVKIAVASKYGRLVDLHFGHASEFRIYQGSGNHFTLLETRQVDKYCTGIPDCDTEEDRRDAIIEALRDCSAVLTMRIGFSAKERLRKKGIRSVESCDSVENGLRYAMEELKLSQVG